MINKKLETAPSSISPSDLSRPLFDELSHFHLLTLNFLAAEVYAKYFDTSSQDPDISSLVAAIVAQLNGTNPTGPVVDGGSFETSTASFPLAGQAGALTQNDQTTGAPRAYLNWLVFDNDHVLIPQKSGFKRITTAAHDTNGNGSHERIFSPQITIDQPGYLYIYLSNEEETQLDVFFDDFKVEHMKSPVVQMDDYYPFGLTFNSYKRENSLENKIKFQGQEHVDDLNLGWVSFKWRNHDPAIGRFFNVDPLAEKYVYNSPYAFSENKVTSHIELEGLEAVTARSGVQNLVIVVQGYTGVDPPNGATQAQNSPRTSGGIDHGGLGSLTSLDGGSTQVAVFASSQSSNTQNDVAASISAFKSSTPDGKVVLVGHSLGADNMVEMVNNNKGLKIDGLITLDIADYWDDDNIPANVSTAYNYYQTNDFPGGEKIEIMDPSKTSGVNILAPNSTHRSIDNDLKDVVKNVVTGILQASPVVGPPPPPQPYVPQQN